MVCRVPVAAPHGCCRGSLINHLDETVAGCTAVEDGHDCGGLELRHESGPTSSVAEHGGFITAVCLVGRVVRSAR
jgi:hypothetical protein